MSYTISLTSIPPRFGALGDTLETLLAQDRPAEEIALWLPRRYRRFPEWDGTPPDLPKGVVLRRLEDDLGPATKVLPALAAAGPSDEILFCDDDRVYPPGWSTGFLEARAAQPNACVALAGFNVEKFAPRRAASVPAAQPRARWRKQWQDPGYLWRDIRWQMTGRKGREPTRREVRRAGMADIFCGYGGVMVRPSQFPDAKVTAPECCFAVDDVWLSGELARAGTPIWLFAEAYEPEHTGNHRTEALFLARIAGRNRIEQNRACIRHYQDSYGIW